jgi:hypothetical protein
MHMLIVVVALAFVALTPYVQAQPRVDDAAQIAVSGEPDDEVSRDSD